jgi:DNA-binding SARP family transcriptional activator
VRRESGARRSRLRRPRSGEVVRLPDDVAITLDLFLEALSAQQRTNRSIYRLVRELASGRPRPARRPRVGRSGGEPTPDSLPGVIPPANLEPVYAELTPALLPAPTCGTRDSLVIRLLGRFQVLRDGSAVEHWRRSKSRALLKYLVARRQPVPRDALLEILWPDAAPEDALNNLRVVLHALRADLRSIAGVEGRDVDYILGDGNTFQLNPSAPVWVDADAFSAHVALGRMHERKQRTADAMREYEAAEALYLDDYLVEDTYEDWTHVRREELKDQYLMVLTKLADHCLRQGDAEGCVARCHRILAKDVCREDAYRRLMRSYLLLGQRSRAAQWYDLCVQTLRREFDVSPSAQTQALYQQITAGGGG